MHSRTQVALLIGDNISHCGQEKKFSEQIRKPKNDAGPRLLILRIHNLLLSGSLSTNCNCCSFS